MRDLKPICKEYFWAWGDKNISKLAEMFAEDVRLRDWNLTAFGREQTLIANSNIFTSVKTCSALPLYMYQDGLTVACRLNVYINDDNAFTARVFASPGGPSTKICPSAKRATSSCLTRSC